MIILINKNHDQYLIELRENVHFILLSNVCRDAYYFILILFKKNRSRTFAY